MVTGGKTLEKVDTYIRHCDAVIHLIGKAAGAVPEGPAVAALLAKYPKLGARLPPLAEDLRKPQPGVLLHPMGSVSGDLSPAPTL